MLTLGLDAKKRLIYLHTDCEKIESKETIASALCLEAITCASVAAKIREGFSHSEFHDTKLIRVYLNMFLQGHTLLRKVLFEVWGKTTHIHADRNLPDVIPCEEPDAWVRFAIRVTTMLSDFIERMLPPSLKGGRFFAGTYNTAEIPTTVAVLFFARMRYYPVLLYNGEVDQMQVYQRAMTEAFSVVNEIFDNRTCRVCNVTVRDRARHVRSMRHRTRMLHTIREIQHNLNNNPRMLSIIRKVTY